MSETKKFIEQDTLIYQRQRFDYFKTTEPTMIHFTFDTGPTIHDFKIICKRMASALGYPDKCIEEEFGNEDE
jgi:hypothetical protein